MKVKNIMFFGFAAAILSMGAASAAATGYTLVSSGENAGVANATAYQSGRNIVASKSYVDLKGDQLKVDINELSNTVSAIESTADGALQANDPITAGTHTKITYDANGLVTAGEDITLSDVTDVTATSTEVNQLHSSGVTTADLTKLHNVTADATELNYVDGVTSSIQDQLDAKLPTNTYNTQVGDVSSLTTEAATVVGAINELNSVADGALQANDPITAGTHTKITYDANGLVTAGEDITLSDVTDVTATSTEVNQLHSSGVTTADLTKLHSVTADATELNYVDGVTSNIQTQLNSKVGFTDVVPAKGSSCTDSNLCVLMQDNNGYNWYTMVTDAQAGGDATTGGAEKPNPQQQ